ncbi:hypothetical protein DYB32_003005 [Aphanomyces invadans]|uniref:Uncharacterized protein n=1 Tax=Aphanomyces invadans TaxID=157072 RepID=A0A418B1Q8_9STRA|nr:hypothetical protein DYB32_003005 [Aphanomyces invadans]
MDSLAALMAGGQVEPDGEYIQTITIGNGLEMKITVAPDDGQAPGTLFAYHVWNGATCLAEYFAANPTLVQGKSVVEFGAASHHVPGVEHCDLAFFDVVKARFPCSVVLAKTFNVQAVFNAAKTKQEFLYVITRLDTPADRT